MLKQRQLLHAGIFVIPIALALLNTSAFGIQSLTSYFGYTITAVIGGLVVFSSLVFKKLAPTKLFKYPMHVLLFCLLALFIIIHGIASNNIGLTHFYFLISAFWLLSIHCFTFFYAKPNEKNLSILYIHIGISILSAIESIIAVLQFLKIIHSKNDFFSVTGTWVNPNVIAMFLALSLYSVFNIINNSKNYKRKFSYLLLATILFAISILLCRTAYIITVILIVSHFLRTKKINLKNYTLSTSFLSVFCIFLIAFLFKKESSDGRIQIWKNCSKMILESPYKGYGFGLFEKEYNYFTSNINANNPFLLNDNEHINMPYNDFMELAIQGGIMAVIIWILFYWALFKDLSGMLFSILITPIWVSYLVIQLTNFGFQAIPVFALFLLYIGLAHTSIIQETTSLLLAKIYNSSFLAYSFRYLAIFIGILLLYNQIVAANGFYKTNKINKIPFSLNTVRAYNKLDASMSNYSFYNESFGDAFIKIKRYNLALSQYLKAVKTSSKPELLLKCGYCYQQQNKYDSSKYYYTLVLNMQPQKLTPRMALLKLYQQKKDTIQMRKLAQEIIGLPLKVENNKAHMIKAYARKLLVNYY